MSGFISPEASEESVGCCSSRNVIFHCELNARTNEMIRLPDAYREPIFYHTEPDSWYVAFAKKNEIKLRIHDFYSPDMFLEGGTWVEITLSENTAYQKLFRYGHQAKKLQIFWLDNDGGFHKETCKQISFPNTSISGIKMMIG